MSDPGDLKATLLRFAADAGFDCAGFAAARLPPEIGDRLAQFLALGRHGTMGWMEARAAERSNPRTLWKDANSVLMLGLNYGPDTNPLDQLSQRDNGSISVYARHRDYHDVLKKRLKSLARRIVDTAGGEVKVFVDTAPVMEKPLAAQAGIGWQGKHTNLVSRTHGSWLFLGAIFTTLIIEPDRPETDHCGVCTRCLDACPTKAFPAPYQLDARRCISYLTIEHAGPIPLEFREAIGNRIYGCDDCLAVCPWNKFASLSREQALHARSDLASPALATLSGLDDAEFRRLFSGSPIKRTGRNRFLRNVLIAIGNSSNPDLLEHAVQRLDDDSPLVRGAAVWAISRISPGTVSSLYEQYGVGETDPSVQQEWRAVLRPQISTVT